MEEIHEVDEDSTFTILVATDTHLGYAEDHPIKGEDSFITFEEVLHIAARERVDFILLGGDLFHETRPSPSCLDRCINLIRKYCFGNKPIEFELISDPAVNFRHCKNPVVNYEDPNLNVSIPIFTIHGNHDDPTGKENISAMDLLASMGLINYMGRHDDLSRVVLEPVVLRKGDSTMAIYPLSHIRDQRLARLFHHQDVIINRPEIDDDFFNLLVLHQNRANRGTKNYIPDLFIPSFINLVVWGHEHDCYLEPNYAANGTTLITQPGSSVATSLSQGESLTKKVGLLRVHKNRFQIKGVPLTTVRPFIYKNIVLEDVRNAFGIVENKSHDTCKKIVEEMIQEAKNLNRQGNRLPLIRLVVKHPDERQVFNTIRFGQLFSGQVANVEDLLKFVPLQQKDKMPRTVRKAIGEESDDEDVQNAQRLEDVLRLKLEEEKSQPELFSILGLTEGVRKSIDSYDYEAPFIIMDHQLNLTLEQMKKDMPTDDQLDDYLRNLKVAREAAEPPDFESLLRAKNREQNTTTRSSSESVDLTNDDEDAAPLPSTSQKGRGRGRGSRGGRGSRARGKAAAAPTNSFLS